MTNHWRLSVVVASIFVAVHLDGRSVAPQARRESVKATALAVAQSGRPAGAVMSVQDFAATETEGGVRAVAGTVEGLLADFAATNPAFSVQRAGDAVRLLRTDAPAELLERIDRVGYVPARQQISASAAVVHLVGALVRRQNEIGVLGSGPSPGSSCPLNAPIAINAGQRTPVQLLDEIVSQVYGLAWFVLYEQEPTLLENVELGLWCADGMFFRVELPLS